MTEDKNNTTAAIRQQLQGLIDQLDNGEIEVTAMEVTAGPGDITLATDTAKMYMITGQRSFALSYVNLAEQAKYSQYLSEHGLGLVRAVYPDFDI